MGQLSTLVVPTSTITSPAGDLTVRGIGANDLTLAAKDYGPQLAMLFGKVQHLKSEMPTEDVKTTIMNLGKEIPMVLAAVIALGCDDYSPEAVKVASKLPFPLQAELVEAIFRLTFTSEADVKKFVESLTRMVLGVSGALTKMQATASELGIGESAVG